MPLPPNFERDLWEAAERLWTNSQLLPNEYSTPVLALIFLRYADHRFAEVERELTAATSRRRRALDREDYIARKAVYLPEAARFDRLLQLPEGADIGKALNEAMKAIEAENEALRDVLPKTYGRFDGPTLKALLKLFSTIPRDVEGDVFGRIYEYFQGAFAPRMLQKGGEYYTPVSVVRLIVEVLEPYQGRIYDPACGSGGMFVQSAHFVREHNKSPELSLHGIEKIGQTLRLCKMNLAVHGLVGDIREANTYYEDIHRQVGKFDFVMANPPFNQSAVDKDRLKDDPRRFPFGMPSTDNANYLWIQLFYSALNATGRAGFVMANSASDARGSELTIRQRLLESGAVDVIVALSSNFFYTVTLPVTLWFLDRGKAAGKRADRTLFLDAREIYRQVDRAHRDFTPAQVEFLANIVRLHRGDDPEFHQDGSRELLAERFGKKPKYKDIPGLCKVATRKEIEAQGWSLNPGRYIGTAERPADDFDFKERLTALNEELEALNAEARALETTIAQNVAGLLEG
jgi:type I restriction enzyme M protein